MGNDKRSPKGVTSKIKQRGTSKGLGQLTLVEHALCPLGTTQSKSGPLSHRSSFQFMGKDGKRHTAQATVSAAFGLLPSDEFFLWGLLGLAFAQPEPSPELFVTPHFILRSLGCINAGSDRGGSAYRVFRESLKRLAGVVYHCDGFYDPVRREHRVTTFGFLSYSLPIDPASSRAWRIIWDPIFFECCSAACSRLPFNLAVYRELDPASRRLYLFLAKIFWRREWTHWLDVQRLAVDVLGFAPSIAIRNLKQKVKRAIIRLADHGLVQSPSGTSTRELFVDRDDGGSLVRLRRGASFRKASSCSGPGAISELSIYDPLRAIGLDDATIQWVAQHHKHGLVQQWADITLAAKERHGVPFFKKSPQAFFIDSLKQAAEGNRTPPDWWWACKKEQEQRITSPLAQRLVASCSRSGAKPEQAFLDYLKSEGRPDFERLTKEALQEFRRGGMNDIDALKRATELTLKHLKRRFMECRIA